MGFFIFLIVLYLAYKFFTSDSGGSNQTSNSSSTGSWYHYDGSFIDGFYIEERDVYAKGPVYSFDFGEHGMLYGYEEGTLQLRNSTGNIEIQLKKISDGRIVPIFFYINGRTFPVIDKHGNILSHNNPNFNIISVARTLNHMYIEAVNANFNENLQTDVYIFMRELLVFNMMIKRSIITNFTNHNIFVPNNYDGPIFIDKFKEISRIAEKTIDSHMDSFFTQNDESTLADLLKILELPANTRDLTVIKKQYRNLAKKYHPDTEKGSEEKMKKINVAYEEICQLLQAS